MEYYGCTVSETAVDASPEDIEKLKYLAGSCDGSNIEIDSYRDTEEKNFFVVQSLDNDLEIDFEKITFEFTEFLYEVVQKSKLVHQLDFKTGFWGSKETEDAVGGARHRLAMVELKPQFIRIDFDVEPLDNFGFAKYTLGDKNSPVDGEFIAGKRDWFRDNLDNILGDILDHDDINHIVDELFSNEQFKMPLPKTLVDIGYVHCRARCPECESDNVEGWVETSSRVEFEGGRPKRIDFTDENDDTILSKDPYTCKKCGHEWEDNSE